MRNTFVKMVIEHAKKNPNVMLLTGDLGAGALEEFEQQFPNRYINCGIAEQNMISVGAGLALSGKQVIIYSIGNFDTLRVLEFIRNLVCYNNANVKIVAVGAGLEYGSLGFTHYATEDIACMRALPNMSVYSPATISECEFCMQEMLNSSTPCYLRLNKKEANTNIQWQSERGVKNLSYSVKPKAFSKVFSGNEIAIISTGTIIEEAVIAHCLLKDKYNLDVAVFSIPQLKPVNENTIIKAISQFKIIYTLEEHSIIGGLNSLISEIIAKNNLQIMLRPVGIKNEIPKVIGSRKFMQQNKQGYNIGHLTICNDVKEILNLQDNKV